MKKLLLLAIMFLMSAAGRAQIILQGDELKDPERVARARTYAARIENQDTIILVQHYPVVIKPKLNLRTKRQKQAYDRLTYNVKKVWPYARLIKKVYRELTDSISKIPTEKEQKEFVKAQEKKLRAQFEDELVHLSITQGRILIKLVDRETGSTTYEVLKDLKGGFNAFLFQGIARLFGSNLKSEYDATLEDRMIEDIIIRIENGEL